MERERKMEEKQEGEGRGPFISSPMCACIYALGFRPKGQCTTEIRLCRGVEITHVGGTGGMKIRVREINESSRNG